MHKKLFICIIALFSVLAAKAQLYYDENGNYVDLEDATDLSNELTSLTTGSYRIWYDKINYTNLEINGDVKLYLCYYGELTAEKITILSGSRLTIYDGEGSLTCQELNINGTLNVIGGNITVNDAGITGSGNIIINGGQVTTSAINANSLTIGWKKAKDFIKADEYNVSSISINDPQIFIVNNVEYKGKLTSEEMTTFVSDIKGNKLTPPSLQFDKDYILNHLPPVKENLMYNGDEQELLDLTNYTFPTIEGGELLFSVNNTDWVQNPKASEAYTHWIYIKIQSNNESVYPSVIIENDDYKVMIQEYDNFDDDFFKYVVIDDAKKYVEISGCSYYAKFEDILIIPQTVLHEGVNYTVTRIGESALHEMKNGSYDTPIVETIVIPKSVQKIGKDAFINNTVLKSIELEEGSELTFIGETAFKNCGFHNVEIPEQVTLGLNVFEEQDIDGNFNLTINWNQLSENSVLPCQKTNNYTQTLTIPPCASATDFKAWEEVFKIKGGISSVSEETFQNLTLKKEYDKTAEISFSNNPITNINENNLVITKILLGELEEGRFFNESADAGSKVAKVYYNLQDGNNNKICPNDFDILLSNKADITPIDITNDILAQINHEKIYDQGKWVTLTNGKSIATTTPAQDGVVTFVTLEKYDIEFSFSQAEYNSKNVSEANTITIDGFPNSPNYSFNKSTITEGVKINPKELNPTVTFAEDYIEKQYDCTTKLPVSIKDISINLSDADNTFIKQDQLEITIDEALYSSADANKEIPISLTLKLTGNDNNIANYIIVNNQNISGKITPKKLNYTIQANCIQAEKLFDGKSSVIFAKSACETEDYNTGLTDENGKPIILPIKISGEYRNGNNEPVATVGTGYKIFIKPELIDPNPNFVFDPEWVELENIVGAITSNKFSIDENGITQVDTKERFCSENFDNIQLQFTAKEGTPKFYKIDNIPGISSKPQSIAEQQDNKYTINIGVMSDLKPGEYQGTINFYADEECTIRQHDDPYSFLTTVYLPRDLVKQLYHNVIFVDNHDSLFYQYQWYKNDQKIDGEIKQYITEHPELTGKYSVEILTASGIKLHSCNYSYNDATAKRAITVTPYPNPVKAGQPFALKIQNADFENAYILIFNTNGAQVKRIDNVTESTIITLPKGYYSGALISNDEKAGFKIIVE